MRKPVGVAVVIDTDKENGITVVVCNDGSCWYGTTPEWEEAKPIPGTQRDTELKAYEAMRVSNED